MNFIIFNKNLFQKSFAILTFFTLTFLFSGNLSAQTKQKTPVKKSTAKTDLPKITQVDEITVKELFKPNAENPRPLLVNFWATWCVPCREEFPDLVKIDEEFKGKIDFITISLDDLAELNREVPQFLVEMKAKMPAYLLYTSNENEVIGAISKDWSGGLPFTVLYNEKREVVFTKQGKINPEILTATIKNMVESPVTAVKVIQRPANYTVNKDSQSYKKGIEDAKKDIAERKYVIHSFGFSPGSSPESREKLTQKYNIQFDWHGCSFGDSEEEYWTAYNETSIAEIKRKFGDNVLEPRYE